MFEPSKLKKIKFEILRNGERISTENIEKLITSTKDDDLKNFLTGMKHLMEKHYSEAIKWFQLSNCKDSPLLIAILSFKLADQFLYEEYRNLTAEFDCLKKYSLKVYLRFDEKIIFVSPSVVSKISEII